MPSIAPPDRPTLRPPHVDSTPIEAPPVRTFHATNLDPSTARMRASFNRLAKRLGEPTTAETVPLADLADRIRAGQEALSAQKTDPVEEQSRKELLRACDALLATPEGATDVKDARFIIECVRYHFRAGQERGRAARLAEMRAAVARLEARQRGGAT